MVMPDASMSWRDGTAFTLQWGLMMAAMMLPSAAPMILLYRTVATRMPRAEGRVLGAAAFAAVYVAAWLLTGLPVYAASVLVARIGAQSQTFAAAQPYLLAALVATAGVYQLSSIKRACARYCEAPLSFLMRRWRGGYINSLRVAVAHASYCIGCCWALMAILVAVGAMSLPWVLAVTVAVLAEKLLPNGQRTARAIGVVLILLAISIALRPELASALHGQDHMQMRH